MFPDRLCTLRTSKGLTHQDMADMLGITRQAYSNYEAGKREPDHSTLRKLAEFFIVSTDYLLGQDNGKIVPSWATAKDKRDFKKMLEDDDDLMFDGVPIEGEDRQRIKDVLTGLFWEAKQMNKRKKKSDSTNDTKK
ncbi:helix-turn-helix domain-containing protein [Desulfosporosinus meridiei]|uniref:Putative transcriptional regulator n=1 Tax=Desulfosporosinus meridiei (strain ATCC BAA-275 / DSM 13257 / KCTC 12902 / NCIMB 13706 / S10) TaxID=768704 RepID=J7J1U8_DESMD|nr:helix-turn-helix domain-containing protein [Desulfosporosinus meridiei]AFQ46294.1 putative transcriptional regulator [Desulfosporosinus meridiei DSM 13257]